MTVDFDRGVLAKAARQEHQGAMTIVLCELTTTEAAGSKRLVGKAADGASYINCAFGSKFMGKYVAKEVKSNDIVKVTNYQATQVNGAPKLMILDMEVIGKYSGDDFSQACIEDDAPTPKKVKTAADPSTMASPSDEPARTPQPVKDSTTFSFRTPGTAMQTPREPVSPVPFGDRSKSENNSAPTANGQLPVAADLPHQPISSLNPYIARWSIKAKVERKQELKTISGRDGSQISLMTVMLLDEEGSQIEGTFWREMADKMDASMSEGRIYYISGGAVVPSNRKYSTVDNDYKINFSNKTDVKEAKNQDTTKMKVAHTFVSFDCLESRLGKKLPVDLIGVVTNVGALGTIKRQRDGTEHVRRDVTVVDTTRKSVIVTLWRDQAEQVGGQLEQLTNPVLLMSKMRVSDYNGVSISQSYASAFEINPDLQQAHDLQAWWAKEGSTLTFVPAGDGLSGRDAGQGRSIKWQTITEIVPPPGQALSESDPPKYATLRCVLASIEEDQPLYYMANKATNKKVTEQGEGRYVEADGTIAEVMQRRYIMNAQVTDFTGRRYVNVFNAEAEAMLGQVTADQLNEMKQNDSDAFAQQLKTSCWSEWVLDVVGKPREYEGKTRMRINSRRARPVDFVADSAMLIQTIATLAAK